MQKTSQLRHPAPKGSSFQKSRSRQYCITWKNTLPELMETRHLLRTHAVEYFVLMEPKPCRSICVQHLCSVFAQLFVLTLGSVSSIANIFGLPLSPVEWDVSPLIWKAASFLINQAEWDLSVARPHLGRGVNLQVVWVGIKAQMWVTDRWCLRLNPCLTSSWR